ncbi:MULTISPECIES: hypothetical protein [Actinoplanes]|uniref:hypothetical protein n=1 Tax=Actinoplanes TaxID=1865 RepID=UPI0006984AC1|nr:MULTISPECIES: hypothetical protein [Actinoplanes]GLY00680.1 hypothetical protein Acsp01_10590 [Actinoplanes sp. NBRC 101535]
MTRRTVLIGLIGVLSVALIAVLGVIFLPSFSSPSSSPPASSPPASSAAPAPPEQARFIGETEDSGFTVAVHVWENSAIAHLTDGRSREAWMTGVSGGDRLLLTGDDGAVLDARVSNGALAGAARVGGKQVTFALPPASAPAGIYRAAGEVNGKKVRADVIVLPDRRSAGIGWVDGQPSSLPDDLTGQVVEVNGGELRLTAIRPGDV